MQIEVSFQLVCIGKNEIIWNLPGYFDVYGFEIKKSKQSGVLKHLGSKQQAKWAFFGSEINVAMVSSTFGGLSSGNERWVFFFGNGRSMSE